MPFKLHRIIQVTLKKNYHWKTIGLTLQIKNTSPVQAPHPPTHPLTPIQIAGPLSIPPALLSTPLNAVQLDIYIASCSSVHWWVLADDWRTFRKYKRVVLRLEWHLNLQTPWLDDENYCYHQSKSIRGNVVRPAERHPGPPSRAVAGP